MAYMLSEAMCRLVLCEAMQTENSIVEYLGRAP